MGDREVSLLASRSDVRAIQIGHSEGILPPSYEEGSMVFDYVATAGRVGIGPEELDQLIARTRAEFPRDEMMVELHVLRTLQAVERWVVSLSEVLRARAAA